MRYLNLVKHAWLLLIFTFLLQSSHAQDIVELYPMKKAFKWGYIDKKGNWKIKAQFDQAEHFHEGLAVVESDGLWGVINEDGEFVIDPKFISHSRQSLYGYYPVASVAIEPFGNGLAPARISYNKIAFINKQGEKLWEGKYRELFTPSEGLARVRERDSFGYINTEGNYVIKPQFEEAGDFSEGLAAVRNFEGLWGFINKDGEYLIEPQYEEAGAFSSGLAPIRKHGRWGYINKSGQPKIEFIFTDAKSFSSGVALVADDYKEFYINTEGKTVIPKETVDAYCFTNSFEKGLALVAIPPEGERCQQSGNYGDIQFAYNGMLSYIDKKGNIVYQQKENELRKFQCHIDSLHKAEELAEQREQERAEARRKAELATCKDSVVWGNPAWKNYLEIQFDGKWRRIYFYNVPVEKLSDNSYKVMFPPFGKDDDHFSEYHPTVEPGASFDDVELTGYMLSPFPCIGHIPDDLKDEYGYESTAQVNKLPGDKLQINYTIEANDSKEEFIKAHVITSMIISNDKAASVGGFDYFRDEKYEITSADILYNPERNILEYEYNSSNTHSTRIIEKFEGKSGKYYQDLHDAVQVYDVLKFSREEGVEIKVYEIRTKDQNEFEFFDLPENWELPQKDYSNLALPDSSMIQHIHSDSYQVLPVRPTILEPEIAFVDGAGMIEASEGSSYLTIDDLPNEIDLNFKKLKEHELGYNSAVSGLGMMRGMIEKLEDKKHHHLEIIPQEQQETEEAQSPKKGSIRELVALVRELESTEDKYRGAETDDKEFEAMKAIFQKYNFDVSETSDMRELRQVGEQAIMDRYGKEMLQNADDMFDNLARKEEGKQGPMSLQLHTKKGSPISRTFTFEDAGIKLVYDKNKVTVTGESELQGKQQQTIEIPEGTWDLHQFRSTLPYLELDEGETYEFVMFDILTKKRVRYRMSTEPGESGRTPYVSVRPVFSTIKMKVAGEEELELNGKTRNVYRIKAAIKGHGSGWLFPDEPGFRNSSEARDITLFVQEDFPHYLLKATFDGGQEVVLKEIE